MPGGIRPPLSVIESWPPANTVNPESHGPAAIVVPAVLGGIAFILICVRLWARCGIQHSGGLDDILIALSLIPTLGLIVTIPLGAYKYGQNHHVWDNALPILISERKLAIASEIFYVASTSLTKVSVLLFYRRMGERTVSPRFITIIWISIASVIAYSIAFLVVIFVSCRPFKAFWLQVDPVWSQTNSWHCYDEAAHLFAATGISLVQDLIATSLPAWLCWKLQLPRRQKIALNAIFAVGYLAAVIAGIRIYFVWRLFYASYDASWEVWYCWLFALLEVLIASICSSLPSVKVFLRWYDMPSSLAGVVRSLKNSHSHGSRNKHSISSARHEYWHSGDGDKYPLTEYEMYSRSDYKSSPGSLREPKSTSPMELSVDSQTAASHV
ncbi:uncharacterized protein KD926_008892 [Aspergillus affinis]|uniref:uncharacterized protein n=1 Tax=Aspergillus affinis TaxID=1070780 RepID=UPI0022FDB262|nr:uncharacterized protein KD926_008892 [Aspergillus affinis]KAI9045465.1 integral membrane protein [Aspergillus affinis]